MKALLALALILAAAPLRAQEDPSDGQDPEPAQAAPQNGTINTVGPNAARGGLSGGHASGSAPMKITNVHTYANIMALPEHQAAHGILRVHAPGEAWAIGMTAYSEDLLKTVASGAQSGSCLISMSPRAFSDQGCELHVWISEKPAGAPVGKNCSWAQGTIINDATNVGGHWYTARGGKPVKDWNSLCNLPKNGGRYYCNYAAAGWDKPSPPKKCDAVLNFPMGLMPQDVYPDSFPK